MKSPKYSIGDMVKMYDCQEHKTFFGFITNMFPSEIKNYDYEVHWLDEESQEYQPFSYHGEFELSSTYGVNSASNMA
jgi:hypothetical protein